jgi:hypothetical protein
LNDDGAADPEAGAADGAGVVVDVTDASVDPGGVVGSDIATMIATTMIAITTPTASGSPPTKRGDRGRPGSGLLTGASILIVSAIPAQR